MNFFSEHGHLCFSRGKTRATKVLAIIMILSLLGGATACGRTYSADAGDSHEETAADVQDSHEETETDTVTESDDDTAPAVSATESGDNGELEETEAPVLQETEASDEKDNGEEDKMKTKYDRHGALHVNNAGKLVDHNGETVALHGYSTHGINLYDGYVNREFLEYLRDEWHIDIIRLAMYTAEENGYCACDEAGKQHLMDVIDTGVKAATELGLYVIIDWHILSDSNPKMHEDQAADFFDKVSQKYSAYGNVFYEICNEPNVDATWADVKDYASRIIPIIRNNDKYSVILVGTPKWCQRLDEAVAEPITIDDNIMYCLHFYADTHRDDLRQVCRDALNAKLPIFVSEFGTCDASGNGPHNADEADKWIKLLDDNEISYVMWNISNKDETSAMIAPGCDKLNGGYSDDELREPAKWYRDILKAH